jgi:hypothetical protein
MAAEQLDRKRAEFLARAGQIIDSPIPEPAMLALVAPGGLGALLRRRRR